MSEFTKISIHNHFGGDEADCTKDKDRDYKSSFDLASAYAMIDEAKRLEYQLLGQTNSNDFNAAAFMLMNKYCSLHGIALIPGAEINLQNWEDSDRVIHLVILFDPAINPLLLQETMRSFFRENALLDVSKKPRQTDCYFLTLKQLSVLATLSRSIICVHGKKQHDRSLYENPEMAGGIAALSRFLPVATEDNKAYHKTVLFNRLKTFLSGEYCDWLSSAANLSSADRTPFRAIKSPTYIWAGNTFDDLFYSVMIGEKRVLREEDVMNRISYISRIKIDENRAMGKSEVVCSHGINSVIGPSGSGKTLLLDLVKRKLTGESLRDSTSHISEYSTLCNLDDFHLYDADGNEITAQSGYKVVEIESLYQKIIKAYSSDDSSILDDLGLRVDGSEFHAELNQFETDLNSLLENKRTVRDLSEQIESSLALVKDAAKFIEANSTKRPEIISYTKDARITGDLSKLKQEHQGIIQDKKTVNDAFASLRDIAARRHLSSELISSIEELGQRLADELDVSANRLFVRIKSLQLKSGINTFLFDAVQSYNNIISAQSAQVNEKMQVVVDNLQVVAQNCLRVQKLRLSAEVPTLDKDTVRGALVLQSESDSARLGIKSINLELGDVDAVKSAFPSAVGNKPKINKSKFKPPYDLSNKKDVSSLVDVFYSEKYKDNLSIALSTEDVLEYDIEIKTENGCFLPIEELSAGMLSKAYVSNFLDKAISDSGSSTIIVFDQPESNMEKSFLRTILADKFNSLRRTHQLFIATHEPLLVVNADSNEIILADNEKKVSQENHISYSNRSFVGARGRAELVEEIADLIDGGSGAVKQRSDIYEGMKA